MSPSRETENRYRIIERAVGVWAHRDAKSNESQAPQARPHAQRLEHSRITASHRPHWFFGKVMDRFDRCLAKAEAIEIACVYAGS